MAGDLRLACEIFRVAAFACRSCEIGSLLETFFPPSIRASSGPVMLKMLKKLAALLILSPFLLYGWFCYVIYSDQRDMLYFPVAEAKSALASEFTLENDGERLKIWYREGSNGKAILYFGGNSENVVGNIGNLRTAFPDHSLYLMNYRGFGGSTGAPSERGLLSDAIALFDRAAETNSQISVIGRSLGSDVAAHVASERPVDRLVLVTPFDSIENVVKDRFVIFPISMLLADKYDTLSRVASINSSVLAILAEDDAVVPYERSIALVSAFPEDQLQTYIVRGTDHDSIGLSPEYLTLLWEFLAH